MKKILIFLSLFIPVLFGFSNSYSALLTDSAFGAEQELKDLIVTDVFMQEDDLATVTLNNAIQIREVKLIKADGDVRLKFPEYVSKRGRIYPQVEVISKDLYDRIKNAVLSGKSETGVVKSISFRVEEPFMLKSPVRKANVNVTFNDAVVITAGVMKSKRENGDPYWIGYPGRRSDKGNYIKQVIIINKKLRTALEKSIIKKYERAASEQGDIEN